MTTATKTRPRTANQWFGAVVSGAASLLFGWVFISGVFITVLDTHYQASVLQCSGGRDNHCHIVVHAATGDFPAVANLDANPGQTTRVAVRGHPPNWTVWDDPKGLRGWFVVPLALTGCALFLVLAVHALRHPPKYGRARHAASNRWHSAVTKRDNI
jgi:hypothetical protein